MTPTPRFEDLCVLLKQLPDPRRTSYGHFIHPLCNILFIALLAIHSGYSTYESMHNYAKDHQGWLRNYIDLSFGIPSDDTIRRALESVDPVMLSHYLYSWLGIYDHPVSNLSLDGKTIRGSKAEGQKTAHVLSAFDTDNFETIDQITIQEKQNEITAAKQLLNAMDLNGVVVRADAMMCQTTLADIIIGKGGDYCFPVKNNQPTLLDSLTCLFNGNGNFKEATITEKGHGRIEIRRYFFSTDVRDLDPENRWRGLKAVGCVERTVEVNGQKSEETHYFILSFSDFKRFISATRKHWAIENNLHWNLDVVFGEDDCQVKKDHAPSNLNILRKTCLCIFERAKKGAKRYISKITLMRRCLANPRHIVNMLQGILPA